MTDTRDGTIEWHVIACIFFYGVKMKLVTLFSIMVFVLVLISAGMGVFYNTPGEPFEFTTVRGEQALIKGSGLYRYDPWVLAQEGIVWDAVNLWVGLPLFALAIYFNWRNSLRGRLFLNGMLFYFFYTYLQLMVMYAFNVLFLVYVAIYALSAVAFFANVLQVEVNRLPQQISERFPRRLFIAFTFFVALMLILLWSGRIVPILQSGRFPPELAGLTTLETQGFDLGMVVPLMLSSGILLWKRSPLGYLLAIISLSYGLMMSIVLPAWIVVPLIQEGKTNLVEALPFSIICVVGIVLAMVFFRSVKES